MKNQKIRREKSSISLSGMSEEKILGLRLCELPIQISGSWVQECIAEVCKELEDKKLKFKPDFYLADEWLTPEDEPVIGVPFYLVDSTLIKLEQKMMLDVEGGTKKTCLQLLRHELGHAVSYAYHLYKKRKWQKIFGHSSKEYNDTYRYRPHSKNFVRHLDGFYAQYHPDEDFAETFAVWLTPDSDWKNQYKNWKAIKKLEYVEFVMCSIQEKDPIVKKGRKFWQASKLKRTLKNHYKRKKRFHAEDSPHFHDENLKRIFLQRTEENKKMPPAAKSIIKYRREILDNVSMWTGEKKYIINDLFRDVCLRCRALNLVTEDSESMAILKISTYITALTLNYVYTGWFRGDKK